MCCPCPQVFHSQMSRNPETQEKDKALVMPSPLPQAQDLSSKKVLTLHAWPGQHQHCPIPEAWLQSLYLPPEWPNYATVK
jgi:hypothetical protein